jgi:hypothetical protein
LASSPPRISPKQAVGFCKLFNSHDFTVR